jgi:hypothetical protein
VDGPGSLPPGDNAKYTATARWSDGSSRDVTNEATWSTSDESVLTVTAGTVAARTSGEAEVRAGFGGRSHGRFVYVVPSGRFLLRVRVSDGVIPASPIFDAKAEVVSGPAAGLSSSTDWDGTLTLVGVTADVELRVTKDGFDPIRQAMHVDRNGSSIEVRLFPSTSRPQLSGAYQLTINSGTCLGDGTLPEEVKVRTYTAAIWEPGGKPNVRLSGAIFADRECANCPFGGNGSSFTGLTQVLDTRFTLTKYAPALYWNDGVHPSVAERLADGTFLSISGQAIVRPTPEGFVGTLDGSITIYDSLSLSTDREGRVLATCISNSHRFAFVR